MKVIEVLFFALLHVGHVAQTKAQVTEKPSGLPLEPSTLPVPTEQPSVLGTNEGSPIGTVLETEQPSFPPTTRTPTRKPTLEPTRKPTLEPTPVMGKYSMAMFWPVAGDPVLGDCYTVERYIVDVFYTNGCSSTDITYTYYNGGRTADGYDTGYPQETYETVRLSVWRDCDNQQDNPDICSVEVDGVDEICNDCHYSNLRVTMNDCSNLGNIFAPGSHSVHFFYDDGYSIGPYDDWFFPLAFDQDRCDSVFEFGTPSPSSGTPSPSTGTREPTTPKPTPRPTAKPTLKPTTAKPTLRPTIKPTVMPTTKKPTAKPTATPTTKKPTAKPTMKPTTKRPTAKPTMKPTTKRPTAKPTRRKPTAKPTAAKPTTKKPTTKPTAAKPTAKPTTKKPTVKPTQG